MTQAHIAVVDDEPDLRSAVARYLVRYGYRVSEAEGGAALWRMIEAEAVDLVILDLNMPGEDGLTIAGRLRARGPIGIVMLTGVAEPADIVAGLEVGADDYVAKPFDLRELVARVRSVLRRRGQDMAPSPNPTSDEGGRSVQIGQLAFDLEARRLLAPGGREVALTAGEAELLHLFARNPGRVLSRDAVLDLLQNPEAEPFSRSVDARIARLRRKVEPDPTRPRVIRTVHGQGYVFNPDEGRR